MGLLQVLILLVFYMLLCFLSVLFLIKLYEAYPNKGFFTKLDSESKYPIIRWSAYILFFLITPISCIIEVLIIGFTKDK